MVVIRKEQMDQMGDEEYRKFEQKMIAHLNEFFPDECKELGEEEVRKAIAYGVNRAASYGIEIERDVCNYIDLMFAIGKDYDTDPEEPWAGQILNDGSFDTPTEKVNTLYDEALRRIDEVARREEG